MRRPVPITITRLNCLTCPQAVRALTHGVRPTLGWHEYEIPNGQVGIGIWQCIPGSAIPYAACGIDATRYRHEPNPFLHAQRGDTNSWFHHGVVEFVDMRHGSRTTMLRACRCLHCRGLWTAIAKHVQHAFGLMLRWRQTKVGATRISPHSSTALFSSGLPTYNI